MNLWSCFYCGFLFCGTGGSIRQLKVHLENPIGCKFLERGKLTVNSEKEPSWVSVQSKSQISCQLGDEACFLKIQAFSKKSPMRPLPPRPSLVSVGWLPIKCLIFSFFFLLLSLNWQQIWLFLRINSQIGSFSEFTANLTTSLNLQSIWLFLPMYF